jgi:aspartyl-tRNA synthetase
MRFGMEFVELKQFFEGKGEFSVFNDAKYIGGICAPGCAVYTRKQLDQLTDFVKRSQIGAKGLVYARVQEDGSVKSSVDKFYSPEVMQGLVKEMKANAGDLILILSGDDAMKTRKQLSELRLEMGGRLGLRDKNKFALLWIIDFPMFEWSDEEGPPASPCTIRSRIAQGLRTSPLLDTHPEASARRRLRHGLQRR